jgi:hypothetical protein
MIKNDFFQNVYCNIMCSVSSDKSENEWYRVLAEKAEEHTPILNHRFLYVKEILVNHRTVDEKWGPGLSVQEWVYNEFEESLVGAKILQNLILNMTYVAIQDKFLLKQLSKSDHYYFRKEAVPDFHRYGYYEYCRILNHPELKSEYKCRIRLYGYMFDQGHFPEWYKGSLEIETETGKRRWQSTKWKIRKHDFNSSASEGETTKTSSCVM